MNDTIMRHIVAAIASVICLLAYLAGYFSGPQGWWWTVFAILIVYGLIYKLIDAGGHGGGGHH
jgi:hypothetical protein